LRRDYEIWKKYDNIDATDEWWENQSRVWTYFLLYAIKCQYFIFPSAQLLLSELCGYAITIYCRLNVLAACSL
jgi:hypothetical protein